MPKFLVHFAVEYEIEIICDRSSLPDEIANINIPENLEIKYIEDTFDVTKVQTADGEEIPVEDV